MEKKYMPNCDYAWQRYEELQKRAMDSSHVNNYSWGIESALSSLLEAIETGTVESTTATLDVAIHRIISSGARLQRSRSLTLKTWALPPESMSTSGLAEANIELERIGRAVNDLDREILMETACGYTDREIAGRHASTPGAIRVRLSRLRLKLATVNDSASRPARVKLTIRQRI
jgi:DNA-directed RNA polymerase specialized sigma24 family protein